jgi:hypothetical protein
MSRRSIVDGTHVNGDDIYGAQLRDHLGHR